MEDTCRPFTKTRASRETAAWIHFRGQNVGNFALIVHSRRLDIRFKIVRPRLDD